MSNAVRYSNKFRNTVFNQHSVPDGTGRWLIMLATNRLYLTAQEHQLKVTLSFYQKSQGMPHIRLEYSDNVLFDYKKLFSELHTRLAATGAINLKGLRSRAYKLTEYYFADGREVYFINLEINLKNSRTTEQKEAIKAIAWDLLEKTFGHYKENGQYVSLSVYLNEVTKGQGGIRHNIPVLKK